MTLTFYAAPNSSATVTEAVLAELGTPHDRVELQIGVGGTREPSFLAINPNGRVPTIVHDQTVLWEAAAITLYLGETFGVSAGLFPEPGPRRGRAMTHVVWASVNLAEAAGRYAASLPEGASGAVEVGSVDARATEHEQGPLQDVASRDIARLLDILDALLERDGFVCGDYTLADTHIAIYVGWLRLMGVDPARHPNVERWMTRCFERPALRAFAG